MRVRSGGFSNTEPSRSEECWAIDPAGTFFVLSTGLGEGAQQASRCVTETVIKQLIPHRSQIETFAHDKQPDARQMLMSSLCGAMVRAEKELLQHQDEGGGRGGSAVSDLLFLSNGTLYISHVGNNRVYLLRGDTGRQLTIDHTMHSYLMAQGRQEEAELDPANKSRIIRALGMRGGAELDTLQVDLREGDRIVLCSSGIAAYLQNATHLAQLYRTLDPQKVSEFLVSYALDHGCTTSASVVCIEIAEVDARPACFETDGRITALEQICFFKNLTYQEMLQVMPITYERFVPQGEVVIEENSQGDEMYILVEGSCGVTNGGVELALLEAGSSFGEMSLIDRQPRSATVCALEPCRLLVIRSSDFKRLTATTTLTSKLLWNVTHELINRLRTSSDTIRKQGLILLEHGLERPE